MLQAESISKFLSLRQIEVAIMVGIINLHLLSGYWLNQLKNHLLLNV